MLPIFLNTCIQSPPLTVLRLSSLLFFFYSSPPHYTWWWFSFYLASFHLSFLRCSDLPVYLSVSLHFQENSIISSANLRLFSLTPLMLIPSSVFILLKISSTAAVNITGDNVSPWRTNSWSLSFHWAFLLLLVLLLRVHFVDHVNVLLLYVMCPQCLKNCSILDGVERLFIVHKIPCNDVV